MPHLVEMVKKYSDQDFALIGIETTNRAEMSREYVESIGADVWPHLMDDQDVAGERFGVQGVPMNIFVDHQGRIMFKTVGYRPGDEQAFEEMVDALIARMKTSS